MTKSSRLIGCSTISLFVMGLLWGEAVLLFVPEAGTGRALGFILAGTELLLALICLVLSLCIKWSEKRQSMEPHVNSPDVWRENKGGKREKK